MKEEIKKFFRGEVEVDEATLTKYSHDASIFEVRPKLVLFPRDSKDVQNLVKWVNQNKNKHPELAITARCAGTDMSGGAVGESIILDFTRHMNKLIGGPLPLQNKSNWEIAVQPGMFYRDFEKITLAKGLILPCYTASKSLNAIGGMFGNNSAGERTLKYGQTENYVLASKMVFADGNEYTVKHLTHDELDKKIAQGDFEGDVYKNAFNLIKENKTEIRNAQPQVHKNAAGYYLWNVEGQRPKTLSGAEGYIFDLNKLLVGSQGTLGIATEISLKLIPENKHSRLAVVFMNDIASLGRVVDEILTLGPESLETYDDKTMKLAVRFFPDFLKNKGLKGMARFFWRFLPEFKMVLRGGFPKLAIMAEFAGNEERILAEKCRQLGKLMQKFKLKVHITTNEAEAGKYWDIRRESFALLRKHIKGKRTAPFIDDIIVRPEFLPKFLPELNALLNPYKDKLVYTLAGHAGDGNFHVIPLMDFRHPNTAKIILEVSEKVFDLVLRYHGSITAEHNDGLMRTPYLPKMYGEQMMEIFTQMKRTFDPQNIFNPAKKIAVEKPGGPPGERPGTKEYIATHLAIEHDAVHKS